MKEDDTIIDDFSSGSLNVTKVIDYYETYRLLYNLLVGASGFVGLLITGYTSRFIAVDIFLVLAFGALANAMYTMGWAGTILAHRYFNKGEFLYRLRMAILVFGTLFSMLVALFTAVAGS